MDACLTYFMTGNLRAAATAVVVEYQRDEHIYLTVEETGDRLHILNFPFHDFGTFQCDVMEQISSTSQSEVSRWILDRFESDANWELQKHFRNNPVFRSDHLGAEIMAGVDDDGVVLKLRQTTLALP